MFGCISSYHLLVTIKRYKLDFKSKQWNRVLRKQKNEREDEEGVSGAKERLECTFLSYLAENVSNEDDYKEICNGNEWLGTNKSPLLLPLREAYRENMHAKPNCCKDYFRCIWPNSRAKSVESREVEFDSFNANTRCTRQHEPATEGFLLQNEWNKLFITIAV